MRLRKVDLLKKTTVEMQNPSHALFGNENYIKPKVIQVSLKIS
jgi:hypothetical protein